VEISFRTKQLERCFRESKAATKAFGPEVGRRYIQRIKLIQASKSVDDLRKLPGLRFHALTGDRKGTHAVNLTGFYRLILSIEGSEAQVIKIEEVSNHYGD